MHSRRTKTRYYLRYTLITAFMLLFATLRGYGQDTARYTRLPFKNSASKVLKLKETNIVSLPTYKYAPIGSLRSQARPAGKANTPLSILSAAPNPVEGVLKLVIHTDRPCVCMVKVVDILGNDVVTFGYERLSAGDTNKAYNMPGKITPGIYFVKVLAGTDAAMKRISVL